VGSLIVDVLPMVDPKVMLGSCSLLVVRARLNDCLRTEELVSANPRFCFPRISRAGLIFWLTGTYLYEIPRYPL
jgi:hypothetical protein